MAGPPLKLLAVPLALFERDGLRAVLQKSGLPMDDVGDEGPLFWRFDTGNGVPVGFGGLELLGRDAVLRLVVTLPPLRERGVGRAIVTALEQEAAMHDATAVWLPAILHTGFFGKLGYTSCAADEVPEPVRASTLFARMSGPAGAALVKRL